MTSQIQEQMPPMAGLPPEYQPQPIPVAWNVQSHPAGFVVVTIFDATGQRVVILTHEDAERLAGEISGAVPTARSGLIVP